MTRQGLFDYFLSKLPDNTTKKISEKDLRDALNELAAATYNKDDDELLEQEDLQAVVLPDGGLAGQVLKKQSDNDFDTGFADINWGELKGDITSQSDLTSYVQGLISSTDSGNIGGDVLYVNPLNANASDSYTRVQALGRPEKPFSTINGAAVVATTSDTIVIVSNVSISTPLQVQRNIHILNGVTLGVSGSALFIIGLATAVPTITSGGTGFINIGANKLVSQIGWGVGIKMKNIKVLGSGRTWSHDGANGSIDGDFHFENCSVTDVIQGNQGGHMRATNTNFRGLKHSTVPAASRTIHLYDCKIAGNLDISATNTGVIANTICSTNPSIPAGVQTFNFTPNVPILLP